MKKGVLFQSSTSDRNRICNSLYEVEDRKQWVYDITQRYI